METEEKKKNPKRVTAGKRSAVVRKENAEKLKKELREMKEKLNNSSDVSQKSLDVEDSPEISQKSSNNSRQYFNIQNAAILGIIGIGISAAVFYKFYLANSKKCSANPKKISNDSEQSSKNAQQSPEKKSHSSEKKSHLKINTDPFYME